LSGQVLHGSLLQLLLERGDFLNKDISQGSVVLNQHAQPLEKKTAFSNFT